MIEPLRSVTHRNPNLLVWGQRIWLIDHGAAFFRQHGDRSLTLTAHEPVPMLEQHVLLAVAGSIEAADERLGSRALSAAGEAITLVPAQVHAGLTDDPRATLDRLFATLVTPVTR